LRAIVPGWVGINNIKWVGRIEVRRTTIDGPTTTTSYVLDGPTYPSKVPLSPDDQERGGAAVGRGALGGPPPCARLRLVTAGQGSAAST
jgi:DMSO/TMAO reductase YedYZ molybdopterin-dependent catalytic subunit